ncbi:Conidial yellow pigment biosynthesis polyketide synthase [Colletotrichum tanaceti]|uniref:Conidial yellow pigment biosynthesis polyketide synthase n=1 Tax=Colletotrichum tanaceti TaxID=1306861 RepID=A0A4V6DHR2_9PEZI|nr:Conidial yellow pigment biosynthesis polyketide synthase [Colletotrichum tanaceti]TKW57476.1 Conidial yellow pigment biosynthesis polyketide synthase [Colletotrichum tanaceti]
MTLTPFITTPPSAAIFSPQSSPPPSAHLAYIRTRLLRDPTLAPLKDALVKLPETWHAMLSTAASSSSSSSAAEQGAARVPPRRGLAAAESRLDELALAGKAVGGFPRWIETGDSDALERDTSGAVTLPLLAAVHVVQYLSYLRGAGLSHPALLRSVRGRGGGVQGYCIGLVSAVVVAASRDERELVQHAVAGLHLSLAIGAFGDLGPAFLSSSSSSSSMRTLQISLRNHDNVHEILGRFPTAILSTITEPRTVCFTAPEDDMEALKAHADKQGLRSRLMHIRSNLHNPDNAALARQCYDMSRTITGPPFPTSDLLQVPVRSNRTGESLVGESEGHHHHHDMMPLSQEIIETVLTSRCDWSRVVRGLAQDLAQKSKEKRHSLVLLGIGDAVATPSFQELGLEISKVHVLSTMHASSSLSSTPSSSSSPAPVVPVSSRLEQFPDDAIAIVGASCRLPGASSLDELWDMISQGQTRLEKLPTDRFDLGGSYRANQHHQHHHQDHHQDRGGGGGSGDDNRKGPQFYGNFIDDVRGFDNAFFGISPREAAYMDPQQRMLLETAFEAMDSAGYLAHHRRERGDPVGCFIGASYTEYLENTSAHPPSAFTAPGTIRAFLSGRVSYHFGWTGPSEVVDTACSASLVAVHRACRAIAAGECPVALAGGVNVVAGVNNYLDLARAGFLSRTGQCKPFDDAADGYCRADGVGLVVLKSLRRAVADGNNIMGVIPAVATNQGGVGAPGITVPDGVCQRALYSTLLAKSGIEADQVSYVEAHGTGTQVGDPIEMASIRHVFGRGGGRRTTSPLYVGSLKANIGHSETAAGVASLLKVLAMLRHRAIPPLRGFSRLNHKIPPLEADGIRVPTELVPWDAVSRVACISSYGASGSNSAVLCSEWHEESRQGQDQGQGDIQGQSQSGRPADTVSPTQRETMREYPILLSAASAESLQRYATALAAHLTRQDTIEGGVNANTHMLGDLSFTLSERRKHHGVRWSTTSTDLATLVRQLRTLGPRDFSVVTPRVPDKKCVLVFSGQSRTTIDLDPAVRRQNPRFDHHLRTCNEILRGLGCPDVLPYLGRTKPPISDPTVLQCGTVAVQYACARCWIDGGLPVAGVVGHSLGELTALAVSGVLSLEDTLKVVFTRAELIKTRWGAERGTMMAIHADLETVQSILDEVEAATADSSSSTSSSSDGKEAALEIACYNSPASHVVVGKESSVVSAEEILQRDARYHGIRFQRLNVSHGFHSRFTQPLLEPLSNLESTLVFNRHPAIPLETSTRDPVTFDLHHNSTADDDDEATVRHLRYLANHARDPVFFSDAVRRLEKRLGGCVWVEAGWATPVIAMTKRAVSRLDAHTFHSVPSLAGAASDLWRQGITATHWSFLTPKESGLKPIHLPPYSFDHPEHWIPHVDRAMEERKAVLTRDLKNGSASQHGTDHRSRQLVSHITSTDGNTSHRFRINTNTERYTSIVRGHAVRQNPLCPASVYMEAAVMGIERLGASPRGNTITFEHVVFDRPLGCGPDLDVHLVIHGPSNAGSSNDGNGNDSWSYTVRSSPGHAPAHSKGSFRATNDSENPDFQVYEMLLRDRMDSLRNDPGAERLGTATAYAVFSRVVEYAGLLRGISRITLSATQALAEVIVPKTAFAGGAAESTVAKFYDAIALDTFIQVLGLLVNSSSSSSSNAAGPGPSSGSGSGSGSGPRSGSGFGSEDEIYVASAIGKMVVSPTDFEKPQTWTVYATYSAVDHKTATGAVFVFSEDNRLGAFATGVSFVKIRAARLERVLKAANSGAAGVSAVPAENEMAPINTMNNSHGMVARRPVLDAGRPNQQTETPAADHVSSSSSSSSSSSNNNKGLSTVNYSSGGDGDTSRKTTAELKSILSAYTGVPAAELEDDQNLGDIGLDSLGSMELADEMESKLGLRVQPDELLLYSVGSLLKLLLPSLHPSGGESEGIVVSESAVEDHAAAASTRTTSDFAAADQLAMTPSSLGLEPDTARGLSANSQSQSQSGSWTRPASPLNSRFRLETAVYKTVDGLDILADLYIPAEVPPQPMIVALLIHGGGHLTLSRKAVRTAQIRFLLASGILPVSVDYRLCPQVNVIDGPVADVRDACGWLQCDLPGIMAAKGFAVDMSRYVVVGWSTGGTLAMTTAWSLTQARRLDLRPPSAILAFYCPVEYNPQVPTIMGHELDKRTMSLSEIRKLLPTGPTAGHAPNSLDTTKLGWVRRGDPRSELVRALVKEERGMSLLFNGLPPDGETLPYPDADRAAAFSPLCRVRGGDYRVPTYLVFGDRDEIASFDAGREFARALAGRGVRSGFLPVEGARHIFDLGLVPGSEGWDAGVGPGYEFLLEELEGLGGHQRGFA